MTPFALACAFVALAANPAQADQPLWEAGAGLAAISFADYRGSRHQQTYLLPVPYFVYRGPVLKVDRESVRGLLLKEKDFVIDVSINGAVPVKSKNHNVRDGMPNLAATFELGPSFNWTLFKAENGNRKLDFRLPVRPVFSIDSDGIDHVGWLAQPQINLDLRNLPGLAGWNLGMLAGPIFGDARYHQYFYSVGRAYATPTRAAYQARGGYGGMQFIAALSKRYPQYWVGAFVKVDTVRGAVFADSPLIERRNNVSAGFAISMILGASEIRVADGE